MPLSIHIVVTVVHDTRQEREKLFPPLHIQDFLSLLLLAEVVVGAADWAVGSPAIVLVVVDDRAGLAVTTALADALFTQ